MSSSYYEEFHEFWSGGDPGIKKYFLLRNVIPMISIVSVYVLFVTLIGPLMMRNRKPIQMRPLIIIYNISLVAFYVYFLIQGAFFLPVLGLSLVCGGSLNKIDSPIIPEVFELGYQLYVVRCVELLDTVFLVLSKKQKMVTILHVFHHSIVPVVCWFGFRTESSGYMAVFFAVNAFVHVLMYSYYALAALGLEYRKYLWWKKYLTSLQILQFVVITLYMLIASAIGCVISQFTYYFAIVLCVLFCVLFIDYYRRIYSKPQKDEKTDPKNGIKSGDPKAYRNAKKKAL